MGVLRSCPAFPDCLLFHFLAFWVLAFFSPSPFSLRPSPHISHPWLPSPPPAWALMGCTFLSQEKRPRDPVQDSPWAHPRQLSHPHQHQPGGAE